MKKRYVHARRVYLLYVTSPVTPKPDTLIPTPYSSTSFAKSYSNVLLLSPCILANSTVKFEMSGRRSAALVIKYPVFREESSRERRLEGYMLQSYRSWFTFIHDILGCQVTLGDIILVTGCDLTADWATETFVEKSSQFKFEFKVGDPAMLASGSAAAWGTWQSSINVPSRCGPSRSRQGPSGKTSRRNLLDLGGIL